MDGEWKMGVSAIYEESINDKRQMAERRPFGKLTLDNCLISLERLNKAHLAESTLGDRFIYRKNKTVCPQCQIGVVL